MLRTLATALMVASVLAISVHPADAQTKYFAREKLLGMLAPSAAYEGSWSAGAPVKDACSGGSRTTTIPQVCKVGSAVVSDSKCDASSKPAVATSTSACTYSCTTMRGSKIAGGASKIVPLGVTKSVADSLVLCKAYGQDSGVCYVSTFGYNTYFGIGGTLTDSGDSYWATTCTLS